MKVGRKGFMLAEVVVVSVVIATVLVTLFTGVHNVSSAYETRDRYYDVDSLYAAIETNEILKRNNSLSDNVTSVKELNTEIYEFKHFYSSIIGDSIYAYITPYNSTSMLSLSDLNNNVTFIEYLNYLKDNLDFSDENYTYMIIVERREDNNIDDCYYYALKLKY